ncbi:AAA family ATPase [Bradyrhizobium sp. SSUT18]|uniref:AAA family ATPase n=1 Tax=Bradyrhizobium sp. SSUT18 TaxID=3040602 RepID=UPI00244B9345|nr:AAA family ATPase [Bradyrhizobium sp. SSUT18]MDH2400787.1 AAA family ATPase [Bradyrhizobium sp. SSUT18]
MILSAPTARASELVTLDRFQSEEPPLPGGPEDYGLSSNARADQAPDSAAALKLTYFDDCGAFARKRWIFKGIISRGETSAWIAPPGAGKSALLTEISVHAAAQIDWRGHRAKQACGVVVFALERADLFKRRLQVYHLRDGLKALPIAVADAVIDLLNPNCVDTIVSTVRQAEEQFGGDVGLIIIDTYAKGIAANGGDEDKAKDQNRAAANLRTVHSRLDLHIALVGHTGKDETRGARGSNAHVGDVDVMVQISGDATKVAQVIKGNDQPERVVAQFRLEPFELGRDEDGDPITTAIVSTDAIDAQAAPKQREPKLTANQKTLFAMLHDAGKSGLLTEDWNTLARAAGIGCYRRADLTDIRNALKTKGLIREMGDRWTVDH